MPSPSTPEPSKTDQRGVSRRAALASAGLLLAGGTGCIGRLRDRLNPRTYHSDAIVGKPPSPWPTLAHDARRTASRPDGPTLDGGASVTRIAPSSHFTNVPPSLAGDSIVAAVEANEDAPVQNGFVAVDIQDGRQWTDHREKALAAPAILGETAILTSAGSTKAVDVKSGEPRWEYAVGTGHSAPTVVSESVYVGGKRLVALDAVTGELQWRSTDVPKWPGRTAATEETIFASADSKLYALDVADGSVQWSTQLRAGTYDAPVVGEEVVVVTESDSTLRGIDRADGTARWSVSLAQASQDAPAIADGAVYVVDDTADALRSFDAASGAERWQTDLGPIVSHRPAVAGDVVYVRTARGPRGIAVVETATGDVRRIIEISVAPTSSVAIGDDALVFTGQSEAGDYGVYRLSQS